MENSGPIMFGSSTQKYVCLSVTEVELSTKAMCAKDMFYVKWVLQSLGFKVKLLMLLDMDKGAVDLVNDWSISDQSRWIMCNIPHVNWREKVYFEPKIF